MVNFETYLRNTLKLQNYSETDTNAVLIAIMASLNGGVFTYDMARIAFDTENLKTREIDDAIQKAHDIMPLFSSVWEKTQNVL